MTALTHKENDLHNRLIVAEFNLQQVEAELRRLHEENKALRTRLAQPEQEPVAWVETLENAQPHCVTDLKYCSVMQHERGEHLKYIPLYTVPPPRKWQGLTDEEKLTIVRETDNPVDALAATEAKLKEKNA